MIFLSGVPQESVLGPLLFLIYINDLPDGIQYICKIFADDMSVFTKCPLGLKLLTRLLLNFRHRKGALSGLSQFLATESPLKMMKNALYFT